MLHVTRTCDHCGKALSDKYYFEERFFSISTMRKRLFESDDVDLCEECQEALVRTVKEFFNIKEDA